MITKKQLEDAFKGTDPSGCSVPGWPLFWFFVLIIGEPDILDALITLIGRISA